MQAPIKHTLFGQTFWLSAQRCIFWEEQKALVLSDVHLGKTGHFRKAGIAVPQTIFKEDLQRLVSVIQHFKPMQIIAVGDLFHSKANLELELFKRWRLDFEAVPFHLVKGNHDILPEQWYKEAALTVWEQEMLINNICFTHERCPNSTAEFTFCGHIHPGIILNGLGRQSLRLPCFYFTPTHCILPPFSKFTGLATIKPSATDVVYAVTDTSVLPIQ